MSQGTFCLLLLALLSVSAAFPAVHLALTDEPTPDVALPGNETNECFGWRMFLPPNWVHVTQHLKRGLHVFSAPHDQRGAITVKEEVYGDDLNVPFATKKLAELRSSPEIQIINSGIIVVSDRPGTVALYQAAAFIVFEIFVSTGTHGYTIQCSGKFNSIEEATAVCEEPLSTFRLLG